MNTDYRRGARSFTRMTEDGPVTCYVLARQEVPPLGGEFIIYSEGARTEEDLVVVHAARAVGSTGEMTGVSGTEAWMIIDEMMLQLEARGGEYFLQTDDMEFYHVRARRQGYASAEEWLLAALLGDLREEAGEDDG